MFVAKSLVAEDDCKFDLTSPYVSKEKSARYLDPGV